MGNTPLHVAGQINEPQRALDLLNAGADPMARKWNLWGYIDARDGAQAVRRAIQADFTGFEAFIIANADTVMSRSNMSLLAEVFPDVPTKGNISTNSTLLAIDKAKRLLGYSPQYSWRNEVSAKG